MCKQQNGIFKHNLSHVRWLLITDLTFFFGIDGRIQVLAFFKLAFGLRAQIIISV